MNSNVGLVTFITNSPYGSIHKFCPSEDYMTRLQNNNLSSHAIIHSSGYRSSEKQEYNSIPYELNTYQDYFDTDYGLNIVGYINQEQNIYLISKFLNYGLTFVVLNLSYAMEIQTIISNIGKYLKVFNKNTTSPNIALLLRYPETNKWCLLNTEPEKVISTIKNTHPNLVDVLVHPFTYTVDYDITLSTFLDIRRVIEDFYSDKNKFINFNEKEKKAASQLLSGKTFGKKSVYSEKTIRAICKSFDSDPKELMNKLVKCGILNNFPGNTINKYYFKNGYSDDKIIPVLLNIFNNTTYMKKTMEYLSPARHFVSPYLFRRSIPLKFKDKIPMSDRLILRILQNIKVGRTTLSGKKIYLRRYDIGEFSRVNNNSHSFMRFIYE